MKFVVLGKYSEQGLGGFVKNPSDNRQEAAKKITEAAGAKLIEMMTLRGAYDFIAIVDGPNFETAAGMKMLMEATGTIKDMIIMESVDFNKAAEIASKAAASYRPVGKPFL
ncbi:MAG: GYD domain-containing protein [Proteobacteria bacterium]|nr:GYD domain-containing protein [Pseudomonadota bacterium]